MQKKYKENRIGNTELFAMNIETAKQILLSISKTVVYDKRGF